MKKVLLIAILALLSVISTNAQKMPDFQNVFNTLRTNRILYRAYQDSLMTLANDEEWIAIMNRRAATYSKMYAQNKVAIESITSYFKQGDSYIDKNAYDSLFVWTEHMFVNEYDDNFLLEHFTKLMMPYFEAQQDTDKMLTLNHFCGYFETNIGRSLEPEASLRAVEHFKRNVEYGKHFDRLNPDRAQTIGAAYMNLCYALSAVNAISPSECLELLKGFEQFLDDNKDRIPEKAMEHMQQRLQRARTTAFRLHVSHRDSLSEIDLKALEEMSLMSPHAVGSLTENSSVEDHIFYHFTNYMLGNTGANEAFEECDRLLSDQLEQAKHKETITDRDIQEYSNNLTVVMMLMKDSKLKDSQKRSRAGYYTFTISELAQRTKYTQDPLFLTHIFAKLSKDPDIISYLTPDMKEQFVTELAVKAQFGTVLHVRSVQLMSTVMVESIIDNNPELLIGVMGYNSVKEIQNHRKELVQYTSVAAAFHDLGKNEMADIVNNDFRPLTDHEFAIIRRHPELALDYLNCDPTFDKYKDVALGHHKWYNGRGGYPKSFDNTKSPYRPIIDLVTICDCIDAATDQFGRNYGRKKILFQVINELKRDAGTRYNPAMVDHILNNQELQKAMEKVITEDRIEFLKVLHLHNVL